MQNYIPKLIQLNIPFIFLILIAAIALVVAYYLYRKTLPDSSNTVRYILIGLRTITFFLVILLFFTPGLFLSYQKTFKPKFALLIDNSKSMSYKDDGADRWQQTVETVNEIRRMLPSNIELSQFTFNNKIDTMMSVDIQTSENSTDFNSVINLLKRNEFDKGIVISDGNHTESAYPLSSEWPFDTHIYTVGIGKISSGTDISISNVIYQPVTYINKENKTELQIRVENLDNDKTVNIKYYLNNKQIDQKQILLQAGSYNRNVVFPNVFNKAGLKKIRLEIDTVGEETNVLNNKYTFVQNALDNKIKIGLFSGTPLYDSKFTAFLLRQIDNFELTQFIEMRNGSFYEKNDLNELSELDVFIFCGFPGRFTNSNTINKILNVLNNKQPSLIYYLNRQTDLQKLLQFKAWLPYKQLPARIKKREITITNPLTTSINPQLYIFDDKEMNQEYWSKIPPVEINFSGGQLKDNVKYLLYGSDLRNQFPLILYSEQKNQKTLVLNGEGYWKWHFLLQGNQNIASGYQMFLVNLLRWINDRAELKPVMLKTDRNIAHPGESMQINGYIYDGIYQPVIDGELMIQAEWNQQKFNIESINDSSGGYLINFIPPGEGRYILTAHGFRDGIEVGSDKLELEIIPEEKEFIRIDQNVEFLKKMAVMGNGLYVDAADVDSLANVLIEPDKVVLQDRVVDLWYHPVLLTLIIICISIEWILRKRLGLV